jgi:hypothetical protein
VLEALLVREIDGCGELDELVLGPGGLDEVVHRDWSPTADFGTPPDL